MAHPTGRKPSNLDFHRLATNAARSAEQWREWAKLAPVDLIQAAQAIKIASLFDQQATALLVMHRNRVEFTAPARSDFPSLKPPYTEGSK